MRYGFYLPTRGPTATREGVLTLARERGRVTDEWITIFKQLWRQSPASFSGRFYRYSDVRCEPFPVQKPHPPIWVGGHSRAALRRTARHGDGWHPVGAIAASPLPPQEMHGTSGHVEATDGRRGTRFLGADGVL